MAAGLQGDVEGRAAGQSACFLEGQDLGVRQPDTVMGAFGDQLTRGSHDYRADTGVGMGAMACGELDGPSHVAGIAHSVARH
jgi:hypothetical protein